MERKAYRLNLDGDLKLQLLSERKSKRTPTAKFYKANENLKFKITSDEKYSRYILYVYSEGKTPAVKRFDSLEEAQKEMILYLETDEFKEG